MGAAAQHAQHVGVDAGAEPDNPLAIRELAGADAAAHVDQAATLQVALGGLGELAEQGHAVPLGGLLALAGSAVGPALGGRHRQRAHRVTAGGVAGLRIPAQMADDVYSVQHAGVSCGGIRLWRARSDRLAA